MHQHGGLAQRAGDQQGVDAFERILLIVTSWDADMSIQIPLGKQIDFSAKQRGVVLPQRHLGAGGIDLLQAN